ncbi:mechanosensitive ion channel family protein [Kangiella sediminilitoris]|uniref:Mechanosensing system component YbdG n=1 Tax=Kangiella sediminilitoris TaxID=1144748 RepID=A0A1B3B9D5_9GAMM|nr:mechanosensitive ion channel family protein [Kangiella sediminilitoris]AOE49409.1 miniconductance mechanosensitive channel [Kangiella sediminilitoris]
MQQRFSQWLQAQGYEFSDITALLSVLGLILVISIAIHFIFHRIVLRFVERMAKNSRRRWRKAFFERKLFSRIAFLLQGVIIYIQASLWLKPDTAVLEWIQTVTILWVLLYVLLTVFSVLDALLDMSRGESSLKGLPLRGLFQSVKIIASVIITILAVSTLIGKSPLIILSGLGAMTAVIMLVFKDPIMGLVAGIQLSANDMLEVGDWLEMPSYGADGDVIEIALTTVKVRNWDQTITTIPTYALISDSFKNWRGMEKSGGRRIMRQVFIDATCVGFLSEDDITRLKKSKVLASYLQQKQQEISDYNQKNDLDLSLSVNGRRMTNLGTFRAYLLHYLQNREDIRQDMTLLVRQGQSSSKGIPIEVYAFTATTKWAEYENIQSDIFDHIFAILPEFGLRLHQSPTGHDFSSLADLKDNNLNGREDSNK